MITFGTANNDKDLRQILDLQFQNLPKNISQTEAQSQGFVTVRHDFGLLKKMNSPHPHIVARDGEKIVGYALVMQRSFAQDIPILIPMFEEINGLTYEGEKLGNSRYFVMGQVCVDKTYRGRGVFAGLYDEMQKQMRSHFDYIITEIASRNTRSVRAHEKVGFKTIHSYHSGEDWAIVLLSLK